MGGGVQTESCGRLKKKLELGAGPSHNRAISDIKSCDRKGRFVKGQWWNANEVRRFEMAADGGITSAGKRNVALHRAAAWLGTIRTTRLHTCAGSAGG